MADRRATTIWDLTSDSRKLAAFFKHADRDPQGTIEFREDEIDAVLVMACQDFGRITGGMPVEAQVFELWVYSLAYEKVSNAPMRGHNYFLVLPAACPLRAMHPDLSQSQLLDSGDSLRGVGERAWGGSGGTNKRIHDSP